MFGSATAAGAARRRARAGGGEEDRHYSWLEDYLATLEGKEAREEYYAGLEYELPVWPRGGRLPAPVKEHADP